HEAAGFGEGVAIIDDDAMEFGQLYRSTAVIGASETLPPALRPEQWNGQPGTRAPHVVLEDGRSTLGLFQRGWVVLVTDDAWRAATATVGKHLGIDIQFVAADVRERYGIGLTGASIIRPDGYIACRSADMPTNPERILAHVLAHTSSAPARPM